MRLLGIDYGTKRIGLALSDEGGNFAFPHSVISNEGRALSAIAALCEKEGVERIVIGESHDLSGRPNPVMENIALFAKRLGEETKLKIEFEPEFMTTAEASRIQGEHVGIDASAAALILKSFIDKQRRKEV